MSVEPRTFPVCLNLRDPLRRLDLVRLDPIEIVPYDPAWPGAFERERRRLERAFGQTLTRPIEHIGSTSVPGLPAKPIIDMAAMVTEIEAAASITHSITASGWIAAPESDDLAERRLSFSFPSIEHRSHHLHVVEETISDWRGWLAFRDHLRAHSEVAKEYALLKERLADAHGGAPNDRQPYRAGKRSFISEITEMALAEAEHGA